MSRGPRPGWTRRDVVRLGALGLPLAGAYLVTEYPPGLEHDEMARQARGPLGAGIDGFALKRDLVRYASRCPWDS